MPRMSPMIHRLRLQTSSCELAAKLEAVLASLGYAFMRPSDTVFVYEADDAGNALDEISPFYEELLGGPWYCIDPDEEVEDDDDFIARLKADIEHIEEEFDGSVGIFYNRDNHVG